MLSVPRAFDATEELAVYDATRANADAAYSDLLEALRERVAGAYGAYSSSDSLCELSSIVTDLDGAPAKALKSNYPKLRTGVRKEIGAEVLRRSKKCCLCGHAPAGQLDHHLPKQLFPEFSALTLNLVPVCAVCNHAKSDTYRRDDGGASFLHAYRDALPEDEYFLRAEIVVGPTVTAAFRVVQPQSMPDALFATLENHFNALKLAETYGELSAEVLVEKLTPLYEYRDEGGSAAVQRYLLREARGIAHRHGLNHWEHVLLAALANDDRFCDGGFEILGERDEAIFQ